MSEEKLMSNPVIQNMMEKFFNDKFKDMVNQQPRNSGNCTKVTNSENMVRSPSDVTVYAPALQKRLTPQNISQNVVKINSEGLIQSGLVSTAAQLPVMNGLNHDNSNIVTQFVELVHQVQHPEDFSQDQDISKVSRNQVGQDMQAAKELKDAQLRVERTLIEAEKFKARIEPPGNQFNEFGNRLEQSRESLNMLNIGSGVSDDDFFHLTCHIDPNLIHKIEKGEFIELEKLLLKDKIGKSDENRLEWVQRDEGTYLVPAQRDNKNWQFL